jgi:DNA polymerase III epsilon subunit-like protein
MTAASFLTLTRGVRFVVLDLEWTPSDTGLRIVQFGHAVYIPGENVRPAAKGWYIDPGCPIENAYQHGIRDQDVAGARTFAQSCDDIERLLVGEKGPTTQTVLVAHYVQSDLAALRLEYDRLGRALPDLAVLDTWALARLLRVAGDGSNGLKDLLGIWNRKPTQHHDAIGDADDARFLLDKLLQQAAVDGWNNIDVLIDAAARNAKPIGEPRLRTIDYPAAQPERGQPSGKRFLTMQRPQEHFDLHDVQAAVVPDKKKRKREKRTAPVRATTQAGAERWLAEVRECVELRCPLLWERAGAFPSRFPAMFEALEQDLAGHIKAGRVVDANTTLTALASAFYFFMLPEGTRAPSRAAETRAHYDGIAGMLFDAQRCDLTASQPDACPGCRSSKGCAFDTWPKRWATTIGSAGYRAEQALTSWLGPQGRIAADVAVRPGLAAAMTDWILGRELNAIEHPARTARGQASAKNERRIEAAATGGTLPGEGRTQREGYNTKVREAAQVRILLAAQAAADRGVVSALACLIRTRELAADGQANKARADIDATMAALVGVRTPEVAELAKLRASVSARGTRLRPRPVPAAESATKMEARVGHTAPERASVRRFTLAGLDHPGTKTDTVEVA